MARQELLVQDIGREGIFIVYLPAEADGHAFNNVRENVFVHVKNSSGSSVDVTIDVPRIFDGLTVEDRVVSIPAGEDRLIGSFPNNIYAKNDTSLLIKNAIYLDYSSTNSIFVAAIKVPKIIDIEKYFTYMILEDVSGFLQTEDGDFIIHE